MTRAVVLGGGGYVGVAWQTGVVAGLTQAGIDVSHADSLVGTSAGAIVGVRIALGLDMLQESERFQRPPEGSAGKALGQNAGPGSAELTRKFLKFIAAATASDVQAGCKEIGRRAMEAETASEEAYLSIFARLVGLKWPSEFSCTAVDVATGAFVVWDATSGVELVAAVGASCAIPFRSPPVTVNGRHYIDGGMRSFTNADLATGHDQVLVLAPLGDLQAPGQTTRQEVAALTKSGAEVALITPDATSASVIGLGMMNLALQYDAAQAGLQQGSDAADGLRNLWGTTR